LLRIRGEIGALLWMWKSGALLWLQLWQCLYVRAPLWRQTRTVNGDDGILPFLLGDWVLVDLSMRLRDSPQASGFPCARHLASSPAKRDEMDGMDEIFQSGSFNSARLPPSHLGHWYPIIRPGVSRIFFR
jgi:hypothetical protein